MARTKLKFYIPLLIITVLSLTEGFFLFERGTLLGPELSSLLHFAASLAIGMFSIYILNNFQQRIEVEPESAYGFKFLSNRYISISVGIGFLFFAYIAYGAFKIHPIDHKDVISAGSDVIPQVMYFVKRFVAFEFPYNPIPIPEASYTLTPTYLPLQWLPYIAAELLGFDYRFIPVIIMVLALSLFTRSILRSELTQLLKFILSFMPLVFICFYYHTMNEVVDRTLEVLIASYYILLCLAIVNHKKYVLLIVSLIICLLSRYSLLFWLPGFAMLYFYNFGAKKSIRILLGVVAGILLIYGPFVLKQGDIFIKGYNYYTQASLSEWKIQDGQVIKSYPPHLGLGLGLAVFVYKWGPIEIADKIDLIKNLHIYINLFVIICLSIYYYQNRDRLNFSLFAVFSLKISLSFFYGFIIIPYNYIYIVPMMMNFVIIYLVAISTISTKSIFSKSY